MERAIHRSAEGRPEPTGRRAKARAACGVATALAVVAFAAVAVAPAGATSARSGGSAAVPRVRSAPCLIKERAGFKPTKVVEGRNAHLFVVLRNCTSSHQTVDLIQFGRIACIVVDPVSQQVTLGADQTKAVRSEFRAPSCAGRGRITARVTSLGGERLATRTAHVEVLAPPPLR